MLEKEIEAKLTRAVKAEGGLCYKFVSPSASGVPDRIVIMPGGKVYFVELKAERGRLAPAQERQLEQLSSRGAQVRVLKGPAAVEDFLKEVMSK